MQMRVQRDVAGGSQRPVVVAVRGKVLEAHLARVDDVARWGPRGSISYEPAHEIRA